MKELRELKKITRGDLAKDICSEKYLYMIEKGSRNPSTQIVRYISDKIGIDLFGYYEYLDCDNPIQVCEIMSQINIYRGENNLEELKRITASAKKISDFSNTPWKYELKINELIYDILKEGEYEKSIIEINNTLSHLKSNYPNDAMIIHFSTLLSIIYQLQGNFPDALKVLNSVAPYTLNKNGISKYVHLYISFRISLHILNYQLNQFDEAMFIANELIGYQKERGHYERMHISLFYLSFCFYKCNMLGKCIETFTDALSIISVFYRPMDISVISYDPVFFEILNNPLLPEWLVKKTKDTYFSTAI